MKEKMELATIAKIVGAVFVVMIIIALLFWYLVLPIGQEPEPDDGPPKVKYGIAEGEKPRNFTLKDTEGLVHELYDYTENGSRPLFLEFLMARCVYCERMGPVLNAIFENYSEKVDFISVVSGSSTSSVKEFKQKCNHTWPYLVDESTEVFKSWNLDKFPTFFIIDRDGLISWSEWNSGRGNYSYNELAEKLDDVTMT
jgi:peroxiredoxin